MQPRQTPVSSSATVVLTEEALPPAEPIYPTKPISEVPYLDGYAPSVNVEEAQQYQWDPISDTFLLTTQGQRIVLDRNDFIRRYFGDQAEQIFNAQEECIRREAEKRRRLRLQKPLAIRPSDRPAEGIYRVYIYYGLPGETPLSSYSTIEQPTQLLTRSNMLAWLQSMYDKGELKFNPQEEVRIDVVHPLMFDWTTGEPSPDAQEIAIGDETVFDFENSVLREFVGLEERLAEDEIPLNAVAIPILVRPRRTMPVRQVTRAPLEEASQIAAELYPDNPFERKKYILEQLVKRHSAAFKYKREADLFREISEIIRANEALLPGRLPVEDDEAEIGRSHPDSPERVEARTFLLQLIRSLQDIYEGGAAAAYDPDTEEHLLRLLVESVLNIDLDAPLDYVNEPNYWREWQYLAKKMANAAYVSTPPRNATEKRQREEAQRTLMFMVDVLEEIVEDARQRWAYAYTGTEQWPILDKETGLIVGYKARESQIIDWNETPLAVEAQNTNIPDNVPLGAPLHTVKCHRCKRERAASTDQPLPTVHIHYKPTEPTAQQPFVETVEEDCAKFGFVWQPNPAAGAVVRRRRPGAGPGTAAEEEEEQPAPENLISVVWDNDTQYIQTVVNNQPLAFFASRVQEDPFDKSHIIVDTFNSDIGQIRIPIATTSAAWIGDVDRQTGDVTLRDKNDKSIPLRGGRAIAFFCITPDGRRVDIPLRRLVRRRALEYTCGDLTLNMPPRFAAVAHRLQALQKLLSDDAVFPPGSAGWRRLKEQIARLERVLHNAPQETYEEMAHRMTRTFAVHEHDDWLDMLDQIDQRALQQWRDRTQLGYEKTEAELVARSMPARKRAKRGTTPTEEEEEATNLKDIREMEMEAEQVERARRGIPTDDELVALGVTIEEMKALGIPEARAKQLYTRVLAQDLSLAEATDIATGDFIGGPTAEIQDRMDDIRDNISTKRMMIREYKNRRAILDDDDDERAHVDTQIGRLQQSVTEDIVRLDELSTKVEQDPLRAFKGPRRSVYSVLLDIMADPEYSRGVHFSDLLEPYERAMGLPHQPPPFASADEQSKFEDSQKRLLKTINAVLNPGKRAGIPRIFVVQLRGRPGIEPLGLFILRTHIEPENIVNIVAFAQQYANQNLKQLDVPLLTLRLWQDYFLRRQEETNMSFNELVSEANTTLKPRFPGAPIDQAVQNIQSEVEERVNMQQLVQEPRAARSKRKRSNSNEVGDITPGTGMRPLSSSSATVPAQRFTAPPAMPVSQTVSSVAPTPTSAATEQARQRREQVLAALERRQRQPQTPPSHQPPLSPQHSPMQVDDSRDTTDDPTQQQQLQTSSPLVQFDTTSGEGSLRSRKYRRGGGTNFAAAQTLHNRNDLISSSYQSLDAISTWADVDDDASTFYFDANDDDGDYARHGHKDINHGWDSNQHQDSSSTYVSSQPYAVKRVQSLRRGGGTANTSSGQKQQQKHTNTSIGISDSENHGSPSAATIATLVSVARRTLTAALNNMVSQTTLVMDQSSSAAVDVDSIVHNFITPERMASVLRQCKNDTSTCILIINNVSQRINALAEALSTKRDHTTVPWTTSVKDTLSVLWDSAIQQYCRARNNNDSIMDSGNITPFAASVADLSSLSEQFSNQLQLGNDDRFVGAGRL